MVLLHGFTNDWRSWRPVLPLLEPHYRVFAPTLAGHLGAADLPTGTAMSIRALADAVERQLDAQGIEKAHFVGNSQGGWSSLELAARGRALSVVALCPAGGWEPQSPEERAVVRIFKQAKWKLRFARPGFKVIASRPRMRAIGFRDAVAHPSRLDAASALGMLEAGAGCRIVDEMLALADEGDAFGELGPIGCPVTIATATNDRIFRGPSYYTRMRRLLPDAEWTTLDGVGHVPMTDDPELIAKTILAGARTGSPATS
jgi:pimeloyl-ACP methyl ester carboxylesterase